MVVSIGKKPLLLWTDTSSIWERPAAPETLHFTTGALDVERPRDVDHARDLLPRSGKIAFLGEDRARAAAWGFDAALVNPKELVDPFDKLRTTKTAYEVLCLAEANRRAALGHDAVLAAFRDGDCSELDLHLLYLRATAQDDPETPYKNIVALGENAAVLHHIDYRKSVKKRDAESLLLDAGAGYQGYCSDITRTWVKGSGAVAAAFTALVDGVEAMQKRLCAAVKTGSGYESLHEESHRQVAQILKDVGVAPKASVEEIVANGVSRAFYPHGLGHSLGLQCHDVGCAVVKPKAENPFLRNTSTIARDQVFTIEPGIYFIDGLVADLRGGKHAALVDFAMVDRLRTLGGVRIEDDVVVLDAGVKNLTREHLPRGGGTI